MVAIDLSKWTQTINQIAKDLHTGKLNPIDLNPFMVTQTYQTLVEGAESGYGKDWIKYDLKNASVVNKLKSNMYLFSGVKCYETLKQMNSKLVDANGKIRSFESFRREVFKIHKSYNKNYLQAEYQTAKASAQMAKQWQKYQDDPNCTKLKYKTVGDDKVRDEHAKLNNVVKYKTDPFWSTYTPPNGWRCRCYLVCTKSDVTTDDIKIKIDKRFANNPGQTHKVFNDKHPYFAIETSDIKEIERMLENWKKEYPQYKVRYKSKNGAKVSVSSFADNNLREIIGNYKVATLIADKLGLNVKLTAHVAVDGIRNPEYLIGKLIADRKSPNGKNLRTILRSAKNQGVEMLVIDMHQNTSDKITILNKLAGAFKDPNNYKSIKEVTIISKNRKKVEHFKRIDIKKSKK